MLRPWRGSRSVPRSLYLGGSGFGGLYTPTTQDDVNEAVRAAVARGVRVVDTAPHYGLGLAETRLGEALRYLDGRDDAHSDGVLLYTKVGRLVVSADAVADTDAVEASNTAGHPSCVFPEIDPAVVPVLSYTAAGAALSHVDSVRRLGRQVHGLRVHDADDDRSCAAACAPGGALSTLHRLKASGSIHRVSAGGNSPRHLLAIARRGRLDDVMAAGCWNLLDTSGRDLLLYCQDNAVAVQVAGVYASGLLAGGSTYQYSDAVPVEVAGKARAWAALAAEYDLPLPVVAMAFSLMPACVQAICVGARDAQQVRQNVDFFRRAADVPAGLWREAVERGLVAAGDLPGVGGGAG